MKLASEMQSNNLRRAFMFNAFWLINATATFLFGLEFVGVVFVGIYAMLPIAYTTAQTLAAVTGGIASLAVLDVAYRGWQWQAMNTAETMPQVVIARAMGWFSFLLSCAYSAIVLVLAMPLFGLTGEQTAWIHLFGGISFVVITIAHLLAAVAYEQASISYKEKAVLVNMSANRETERLDFLEKVQRQALLQTRAQVATQADALAGDFQQIWAAELLEATRPKSQAWQIAPQILENTPATAVPTSATHTPTAVGNSTPTAVPTTPAGATTQAPHPNATANATAVPSPVNFVTIPTPQFATNGHSHNGHGGGDGVDDFFGAGGD